MVSVLGIGNWLFSGDGAGPAVIDRLSSDPHLRARATCRDSGTVGLALLPEIEASYRCAKGLTLARPAPFASGARAGGRRPLAERSRMKSRFFRSAVSYAFIAVDAVELGIPASTVQVFLGEKMHAHLCGRKKTFREVALADLLGVAMQAGTLPSRRALLAIPPEALDWGSSRSQAVIDAVLAAGLVSLFASVLFLILASPEVAMTDAAIGSGLTTFLFFFSAASGLPSRKLNVNNRG